MEKASRLATLVFGGLVGLAGILGCEKKVDNSQYNIEWESFGDTIRFVHMSHDNVLTVKGELTKKVFIDVYDDLTVDYLNLTEEGDTTQKYEHPRIWARKGYMVEKLIMDGAQKQFDEYLKQIKEIKNPKRFKARWKN